MRNKYVVRVDPQGQTMVVDILDMAGVSVPAYESPQFAATARALPLTITTQTDFCLAAPGAYDVSCKVGGSEVADAGAPKRVRLTDVPVLVTPDWERQRTAASAASSVARFDIDWDLAPGGLVTTAGNFLAIPLMVASGTIADPNLPIVAGAPQFQSGATYLMTMALNVVTDPGTAPLFGYLPGLVGNPGGWSSASHALFASAAIPGDVAATSGLGLYTDDAITSVSQLANAVQENALVVVTLVPSPS